MALPGESYKAGLKPQGTVTLTAGDQEAETGGLVPNEFTTDGNMV
jgi:hypothetical protein